MAQYSVTLWGSDPDAGNDDCWTGWNYETLAEAELVFADPWGVGGFRGASSAETHTIVLDGPDVHRKRRNVGFRPERDTCDDWRREQAMQAGMAFGCAGYNEAMGYDLNSEDD